MHKKTEAQKRAQRKYLEQFSFARIRMTAQKYKRVQEHARSMGESVNGFVNRAIETQIRLDNDAEKEV